MNSDKIVLGIFVILAIFLYQSLVINNPNSLLFQFREKVELSGPVAEVKLELPKGKYVLRIKHKAMDNLKKTVTFNGALQHFFKIRKDKKNEISYSCIESEDIKRDSIILVSFGRIFPQNLDVRVSDHLMIPNENLSDDVIIFFKSSIAKQKSGFGRIFILFLFFSVFFSAAFRYFKQKTHRPLFYLSLAVSPTFVLFSIAVMVNLIPVNPYLVLISPFFFFISFLFTFWLILCFII